MKHFLTASYKESSTFECILLERTCWLFEASSGRSVTVVCAPVILSVLQSYTHRRPKMPQCQWHHLPIVCKRIFTSPGKGLAWPRLKASIVTHDFFGLATSRTAMSYCPEAQTRNRSLAGVICLNDFNGRSMFSLWSHFINERIRKGVAFLWGVFHRCCSCYCSYCGAHQSAKTPSPEDPYHVEWTDALVYCVCDLVRDLQHYCDVAQWSLWYQDRVPDVGAALSWRQGDILT